MKRFEASFTVLVLVLALVTAGCGASAPGTGSGEPDFRRLYPLGDGYVWSYDIDTGEPPPVLGVFRVASHRGNRFEVHTNGDPLELEVRDDGIYRADHDAWLLKAPLRVGARWHSALGGDAEVTNVHATVQTGEGLLRECVEVHEAGETGREQRSVYCPGIGLALLVLTQHLDLTPRPVVVTATLRGHSFGEDDAQAPPDDAPQQPSE